jgi:Zn-dependent protease/CBS domain-containing protein
VNGGLKIGRLFGIDVRVRAGWLVIVGLLTLSLATAVLPAMFAAGQAVYWSLALAASLLLFGSVLVHELAHSLVARAQGIEVRGITLFLLGGVATIEEEPRSPWREALMAGVGPLTSVALGGALLGVAALVPLPPPAHALALYLGYINLVLAVFNMLPGFPLDGGRVLRAALWGLWHDHARATSGAATAGRVVGWLLAGAGVFIVLRGDLIGGLWMGLVGWMLVQSARSAGRLGVAEDMLRGVPAGRMAAEPPAWVPPQITLHAAVQDYLLPTQATCLPVAGADAGEYEGVLCVTDLREVDRRRWQHDRVAQVMRGRDTTVEVDFESPALDVLHLLAAGRASVIAVVRDGRLLGLVDDQTLAEYVARSTLAKELHRTGTGSVHVLHRPSAHDRHDERRAA